MKISYLGPSGTFTQEALFHYTKFLKENIETVPANTIEETLEKLETSCDFALVPVENSLGGCVYATLDYLMKNNNLLIFKEIIMPINHYLYGITKIPFERVTKISSHHQALLQCSEFLKANIPQGKLSTENSTTECIEEILLKKDTTHLLIGSSAIKDFYPLEILAGPIQNNLGNWTRFLVVGKNKKNNPFLHKGNKLSLVCKLDGLRPGALYEALSIFAKRNINLVHIESRPLGMRLGEYKFFFDMIIQNKKSVEEATKELKTIAHESYILGIYDTLEL